MKRIQDVSEKRLFPRAGGGWVCALCLAAFAAGSAHGQLIVPKEARPQAPAAPAQVERAVPEESPARDQEHPPLEGLKVRCPVSIRAGELVFVEIESENPDSIPRMGTLALSIQGGRPSITEKKGAYDLFLPGGRGKLARFTREGEVWKFRPRSENISPEMTHVELYEDQWPAKGTRTLSVPVVFQAPGTAVLLVRATFAKREGNTVVVDRNCPEDANDLDEQGLPCFRRTIEITE